MNQTIEERILLGEFKNVLPFPANATLDLHPAYHALSKELNELRGRVEELKRAKKALQADMRKEYDNETRIKRDIPTRIGGGIRNAGSSKKTANMDEGLG